MRNILNAHTGAWSRLTITFTLFVAVCIVLAGCGGTQPDGASSATTNAGVDNTNEAVSEHVAVDFSTIKTLKAGMPTGSLNLDDKLSEPEDLSEAETEDADRAVRAYTPSSDSSLLINNAKHFYYYEQLTGDGKAIYEGLYQLLSDPTNDNATFAVSLKENVDNDSFMNTVRVIMHAVQFDHPEFFWAYNGLETEVIFARPNGRPNEYYFMLSKPYKRYKKEMTEFNDAVSEFLDDINLNGNDYQIARDIHDKLISTVTYDHEVAQDEENDLAHTAYGALVENGAGESQHAVCDGYSLAYVYLLQQAGIDATVVVGAAGSNKADAGPHAWTIAKLGGDWYEIDPTWDDQTEEWKATLQEVKNSEPNNNAIPYFEEALGDEEFCESLDHFLCNVTTPVISNYTPTASTKYTFDDGTIMQLIDESVHIRANELVGFDGLDSLMEFVPTAKGTKYAYVS